MFRRNSLLFGTALCLVFSGLAVAQGMGGPGRGPGGFDGPPPMMGFGGFHDHSFGEWWNMPGLAERLGITADQKQKMDSTYEEYKLKLIDLSANLQKQQVLLEPMIQADQPDQAKTLAQIDAVVQARAELEKENAHMLFAIRETLTPDQWQKLKAMRAERRMRDMHRGHDGRGGPGGPGMWRQHQQHQGPPGPPPSGQQPGQPTPPTTNPQGQDQPPAPPQ
ncbi:MAG: Spy/CpxP family protein refolding chaperone [Acidobacteriaceae bacterium]